MSEKIKLKVPAGGEPESEFVSQGNYHAELSAGGTVETESRSFADWLIERHGLTEVKPKTKPATEAEKENPFAKSYQADFPGRDAFIAAEIPFETTIGLTREQLVKVPGIGDQTADAILGYTPAPTVAPLPPPTDTTNNNGDGNSDGDGGENSNTDGGAK